MNTRLSRWRTCSHTFALKNHSRLSELLISRFDIEFRLISCSFLSICYHALSSFLGGLLNECVQTWLLFDLALLSVRCGVDGRNLALKDGLEFGLFLFSIGNSFINLAHTSLNHALSFFCWLQDLLLPLLFLIFLRWRPRGWLMINCLIFIHLIWGRSLTF